MTEPGGEAITIVPYDRDRHGDGPWRVVSAVFEEYGFPFAESDYDADLARPDLHYDGQRGRFAVAEDAEGRVVGGAGRRGGGASGERRDRGDALQERNCIFRRPKHFRAPLARGFPKLRANISAGSQDE